MYDLIALIVLIPASLIFGLILFSEIKNKDKSIWLVKENEF